MRESIREARPADSLTYFLKGKTMKKFRNWSILMLGVVALAMAGCNTLEGAGEDIEAAGDSIQDAAD